VGFTGYQLQKQSEERLNTQFDRFDKTLAEISQKNSEIEIEIRKKTIRNVLSQLYQANLPADDFVIAVLPSGEPETAAKKLYRQYRANYAHLTPERRTKILHQIAAHAYGRDPQRAISLYNEILAIDPDDAEANIRIARMYISVKTR